MWGRETVQRMPVPGPGPVESRISQELHAGYACCATPTYVCHRGTLGEGFLLASVPMAIYFASIHKG